MVTQFQLKNGLRVFLIESRKSPVVSLQAWVRTGSADEAPAEAGLSHFIEHLLFKGTAKFKVGEIAQLIEGAGGELNAYTSFDQTVFYMTLSNQFTELGLEALSEMMGFPAFDKGEIDSEREVVVEEMRRGLDSVGRTASQLLFSTAYGKHTYGRPVIGFEKVVRKVSPRVISGYFHSRYVPRNMYLVITGDFQRAETKTWIQKYFGRFPDEKVRKVRRPKVDKPQRPRLKVSPSKFEQSMGYLGWNIPPIDHKDIPALDLLSSIMGSGESSPLIQKLRIEEPLVQGVSAGTFSPLQDGLFLISFSYQKTDVAKVFSKIEDVIVELQEGKISEAEMKRFVTLLESNDVGSMETVDGLAQKYGHLEFHFGNFKAGDEYFKQLRSLTVKDLVAVSRKYLVPVKTVATVLTPDETGPINSLLKKWLSSWQKRYEALPSLKSAPAKKIKHVSLPRVKPTAMTPKVTIHELTDGTRVITREMKGTPIFSARLAVLGGVRFEKNGSYGIGEILSRTWTGGTKSRSERQLAEELESSALNLAPLTGRNSLSLGISGLAPYQKEARELFWDVMLHPLFDAKVIERERQVLLKQIENKKDQPAQICIRNFSKALFGAHPYGVDPMGLPEDLKSLSSQDVGEHWRDLVLEGKRHLVLAGDFESKEWIASAEEALAKFPVKKKPQPELALTLPHKEVHVFEEAKKEQCHLVVGYPALTLYDSDRFVLEIIEAILAGQGGRLFLELRDKKSLAYSVAPLRMAGIESGYFGAYIGCAPEKAKLAQQMMRNEFKKLMETPVPADELERAQRYTIGGHDIDLQRTNAAASAMLFNDIYGLDPEETFHAAEKYWSVTAQDIQRVARRIFEKPAVVSLVGPRNDLGST